MFVEPWFMRSDRCYRDVTTRHVTTPFIENYGSVFVCTSTKLVRLNYISCCKPGNTSPPSSIVTKAKPITLRGVSTIGPTGRLHILVYFLATKMICCCQNDCAVLSQCSTTLRLSFYNTEQTLKKEISLQSKAMGNTGLNRIICLAFLGHRHSHFTLIPNCLHWRSLHSLQYTTNRYRYVDIW